MLYSTLYSTRLFLCQVKRGLTKSAFPAFSARPDRLASWPVDAPAEGWDAKADWIQQLRGRSSINRNPDGYEARSQIQREEVSVVLSGGSS